MIKSFLGFQEKTLYITSVLLLVIFSCALGQDVFETKSLNGHVYQELTTPFRKSSQDTRSYLGLRLSNELDIILISDPSVDKAATSLSVKVGFQNDPPELPGLAHFCEHLLFTGTKKYPSTNDYSEYLTAHSGDSNAFTNGGMTDYMFQVAPEALNGALDRFSQFFITPLFDPNSIEDEVNAVDSEFKGNNNDFWRIKQAQKNISNSEHPYSRFTIGSRFYLLENTRANNVNTRDELIKFHDRYYSSNLMKLVVIGKESFDELKEMVISKFAQIKNRHTVLPDFGMDIFNEKQVQIKYIPKQDDVILLEFLLPSLTPYYKEKPMKYILKLLNFGGQGSILNELKKKNWIVALHNILSEDYRSFSILDMAILPTPEGLNHREEIIKTIFSYFKLIKEQGITTSRFQELQTSTEQDFDNQESQNSLSLAISLSVLMQNKAPFYQKIGSDSLVSGFNETLIRECLSYLNPDNLSVTVASKSFIEDSTWRTEPWFGGRFSVEKISNELINELRIISVLPGLKLPTTNPFISTNSTIIKTNSTSKFPKLLSNSTEGTLWYLNGNLNTSKSSISLIIKNNRQICSIKNYALQFMLPSIINDSLEIEANWASEAGFFWFVSQADPGLSIMVQGLPEKIDLIIMTIVKKLKSLNISNSNFIFTKEKLSRSVKDLLMQGAMRFVRKYTSIGLLEHNWTDEELIEALDGLEINDLVNYINDTVLSGSLEMFIAGNLMDYQASSIFEQVKSTLNLNPVSFFEKQPPRMILFPAENEWVFTHPLKDTDNVNSGIGFHIMTYKYQEPFERAMTELISELIYDPMFHQLRFIEGLGYSINNYAFDYGTQGGLTFNIQSERDPVHLEGRIENFFNQFYEIIDIKPESELYETIHTMQITRRNKRLDLNSLTFLNWNFIQTGQYNFHKENETIKYLGYITKPLLLQFIREKVLTKGKRQKLSIHIVSQQMKPELEPKYTLAECGTLITNMSAWHHGQKLAPYILPSF